MVILMEKNNIISVELDEEKINKIKSFYAESIIPNPNEYVNFQAKTKDVTIIAYNSRKVVFQGKKAEYEASIWSDFSNEQIWKYNDVQIGSDEVGTGDYFGPLCVCAAYVEKKDIKWLGDLGINDSKKIEDKKILELVPIILQKIKYSQISISPTKYNHLISIGYNQAKIKTVLHNQVLFNLKKKLKIENIYTIVDQFLVERTYYNYLGNSKDVVKKIHFETKAESKYPSVAVASMIARYSFLIKMEALSKESGYEIPKGASSKVDEVAKKILEEKGMEELSALAKIHFKNTKKILED